MHLLKDAIANKQTNEYTGRAQTINMTSDQEIAIGIEHGPQMAQQHGGHYSDARYQALVDNVGQKLVNSSIAKDTHINMNFIC